MTFVVTDRCIRCKFGDCVEVCPVDCFHEGENMLVIDPEECIDCALCVPECPVEAIVADDELAVDQRHFQAVNARYSAIWPVVTAKKEPPPDADAWISVDRKYETEFSENPGR